jgi:hypothetical protein
VLKIALPPQVAENRPDFKRRRLPLANTEGDLHFEGGKRDE